MASDRDTLQFIQVLRAVAVSIVVLFHISFLANGIYRQMPLRGFFMFGHVGVDLFFVLSGFIIFWVHHRDSADPMRVVPYLKARFVRIYPTYWIVLAATLALYAMDTPTPMPHAFQRDPILRAIVLYDQHTTPIVRVAWSLSYEILFYAVFTILILVHRAAFAVVAAVWATVVLLKMTGNLPYLPVRLPWIASSPLILEFLGGCLAAYIVIRWRPPIGWRWVVVAALLCLAVAVAEWKDWIHEFGNVQHFGPAFFLLVLTGAAAEMRSPRRFPAPFLLIGNASYSIYLVHEIANSIAFREAFRRPGIVQTLGVEPSLWLVFILLLALGVAFYWLIERPLLAASRRLVGLRPRREA